MLRNRLKELDLRITELADYLQVSRPTMYKFIEYYDMQNFESINKKVLKLFNYINEHDLISKKNVINYILSNLVEVKELGDKKETTNMNKLRQFIISNPDSYKSRFINLLIKNEDFDEIIKYLLEVAPLLHKRKLSDDDMKKMIPLNELNEHIRKKVDE